MIDQSNTDAASVRRAPWHLWVVGAVMLIWNVAACYSHVMTLMQNAAYFRADGVTSEMATYFASVPAWYVLAWTIGVWGGLLAAIGLLFRKSWAIGAIATIVSGALLVFYALAMKRRGVLH